MLRAHRRAGVAVALLALLLQFVGLFGHVHPRDVAGLSQSLKANLAASIGEGRAASDHASLPAPDHDALCAVCLVGHLASSAIAPSAPILFAPVAHSPRAPPTRIVAHVADFERPFWSQGPPAV